MAFKFGTKSEEELVGVDPRLIAVSREALKITLQDFGIYDGMRTAKEQAAHIKAGTSWTKNSKHLIGKAVDAVPFVAGKYRWEWPACYVIARAFQKAAIKLGVRIRWGGVWDRCLNDIGDPERENLAYVARRRAQKQKVRIDGPHFEVMD